LKKVLQRDGYEVILAERGEEAVDRVAKEDLLVETVISDYKMPGMDGLETLHAIAQINPRNNEGDLPYHPVPFQV